MQWVTGLFLCSICILIEAANHQVDDQKKHDTKSHEVVLRDSRALKGKKNENCRYKKGPWSECDSSNSQTKTLTLKKGGSSCEPTQVISRKCKISCKYDKGEWSDCDANTSMRERVDVLRPNSDPSCKATRTTTKKCKKECKYSKQGSWSDCDATTGKRVKVLALKSGSPAECEQSKKIFKPCKKSG